MDNQLLNILVRAERLSTGAVDKSGVQQHPFVEAAKRNQGPPQQSRHSSLISSAKNFQNNSEASMADGIISVA